MHGDFTTLKNAGNEYFRKGDYAEAIRLYLEALRTGAITDHEVSTLHNNLAACYLKISKLDEAVSSSSACLSAEPHNLKALYRRAQAYEVLGKLENALSDIKAFLLIDPSNNPALEMYQRLLPAVIDGVEKRTGAVGWLNTVFERITQSEDDSEVSACWKGLKERCRVDGVASAVLSAPFSTTLLSLLEGNEAVCSSVLVSVCEQSADRTRAVFQLLTPALYRRKVLHGDDAAADALLVLLSAQFESLVCSVTRYHPLSKDEELIFRVRTDCYQSIINSLDPLVREILSLLSQLLGSCSARPARGVFVVKAVTRCVGIHKAISIIALELGLHMQLVQFVASLAEVLVPQSSTMEVDTAVSVAAVAISKISTSLEHSEKETKTFMENCTARISLLLNSSIALDQHRGTLALIAYLQASQEFSAQLDSYDNIIDCLVAQCETDDDSMWARYALEALINAGSCKKVGLAIRQKAADLLQRLCCDSYHEVQVRALVLWTKVGMTGGPDATERFFTDQVTTEMYLAAKELLLTGTSSASSRKWAFESLAYLSMDAEVKESLVNDSACIEEILAIEKTTDSASIFAISSILVNLCNGYDKVDNSEEAEQIRKLAQLAKQPLPEPHAKDSAAHLARRIEIMLGRHVVGAFAHISGTPSEHTQEMVARVFLAICTPPEHRGTVVQEGGVRSLLQLASGTSARGVDLASQALAKIAITIDPNLAFPGQKAIELVRPLLRLADFRKPGLQRFEALMALTNLAQLNESTRSRIVSEKGLHVIHTAMFDDHELIKRAGTECLCNMSYSDEVLEHLLDEQSGTDKIKLLVLLSGEEDPPLACAALGALAILARDDRVCRGILAVDSWVEIAKAACANGNQQLQHRLVSILHSMIISDGGDLAESIVNSELFDLLVFLSQSSVTNKVVHLAEDCLVKMKGLGLAKENS